LLSDKVDVKPKLVQRVKKSLHNNKWNDALRNYNIKIKFEIKPDVIIGASFNTPITSRDRASRKQLTKFKIKLHHRSSVRSRYL
jgi:hypothetical protein